MVHFYLVYYKQQGPLRIIKCVNLNVQDLMASYQEMGRDVAY